MITKIYMKEYKFTNIGDIVYDSIYRFIEIVTGMIVYTRLVFYPLKNTESIIVQDTDEIIILETSDNNADKKNILLYLNNNIRNTDDVFDKEIFREPIKIRFIYKGKTYRICLTKLESSKIDHSEIQEESKILLASINDTDITDIIKEYQGNTRNFYAHIPDAIYDLSYLINLEGKLHIYNTMGTYNMHVLKTI